MSLDIYGKGKNIAYGMLKNALLCLCWEYEDCLDVFQNVMTFLLFSGIETEISLGDVICCFNDKLDGKKRF